MSGGTDVPVRFLKYSGFESERNATKRSLADVQNIEVEKKKITCNNKSSNLKPFQC
jgi:hypothetical protein